MGLFKSFRRALSRGAGAITSAVVSGVESTLAFAGEVAEVGIPIALQIAQQNTAFPAAVLGQNALLAGFQQLGQPAAPSQTIPTQTPLGSQMPLLRQFMPPAQFPQPQQQSQPFLGSGNFNTARFGNFGVTVGSGSRDLQTQVASSTCGVPSFGVSQPFIGPQVAGGFRSLF